MKRLLPSEFKVNACECLIAKTVGLLCGCFFFYSVGVSVSSLAGVFTSSLFCGRVCFESSLASLFRVFVGERVRLYLRWRLQSSLVVAR